MKNVRVDVNEVQTAISNLFLEAGVNNEDVSIIVHCLMEAELAGIYTHGVAMVPDHVKKCKSGYAINKELMIEKSTASFTVCDAGNMVGMVSAWKSMDIAIEKAAASGLHAVFCNHANTFSAAYCYAKKAVDNGMMAIVMCNAPSQMAPFGGKEKLLGTNPLAIGIPGGEEEPFILDMATSAVAKSKINQAFFNGETKIPFGWATDSDGVPTDDPKKAVKGLILPMAGPKGYGLAMAIDVFSGLLSHASYLNRVGRFYSPDDKCMDVGHSFIVMDPKQIYGDAFYSEMDEYLKTIRNSESATENPVLVPGDINRRCGEIIQQDGVELSEKTVNELNSMLLEIGKAKLTCKEEKKINA